MNEKRLNYVKIAPDGIAALRGLEHYLNTATALDPVLLGLVRERVSQLNGCEFCIHMHAYELSQHNEPDSRIEAIKNWRDSDAFTERERAALAWAEVLTLLPGYTTEPVTEEEFTAARQHFDDKELVDLSLAIAAINAWNRLGTAFRPPWRDPRTKAQAQAPSDDKQQPEPQKQPGEAPAKDDAPKRDVVDNDGDKVTEEK